MNRVPRLVSRVLGFRVEDSSGLFNMCRFMAIGALRVACCSLSVAVEAAREKTVEAKISAHIMVPSSL